MITRKTLEQYVRRRPEVTSDQYVCGQVVGEYKNLCLENKVVLDLGANIGAFSVYAMLRGARAVYAFEPDPENYALCVENTKLFSAILCYQSAVSSMPSKKVKFFLTNGKARDGFSTVRFRGRREIDVINAYFPEIVELLKPDVIKMDIEGEEYYILKHHPIPDCVSELIVEIHFSKKVFRKNFPQVVEQFDTWTCIKKPKDTGKNFHTLGHWRR